ncbi:MAG: outer membrane lipoprotein-sorting protein [Betaproteobacteria bacterium]|nr:outer membrane lipoprotein-sorting protein [Betaproteobacteria bacterium]
MQRYIEWIIRYRFVVITLTLVITIAAVIQAKNLNIIIDPNTMLPQSHPYVTTSNLVEKVFGSKYVVMVGITPKEGDIYQPVVLEKVQRMTAAFLQTPGVVKENLLSLSSKRAKNIAGTAEGLEVKPLMSNVPTTAAQIIELRKAIEKNPVYLNSIVSVDAKTTAILVEFKDGPGGFRAIMNKVEAVVEHERDSRVEINVGGIPSFLARIEIYSERIGFLFPIAILVLSLVLFEAFRTKQGLVLPLLTAGLAVAWGVGVMGASGIPMDVFNSATPILILAVATGHAVQLLKRYYEEYFRLRETTDLSPKAANNQAVVSSLIRVGPVMIAAGVVASLGFFSLVIFKISTVRTFGIFTGIGILAALTLEMTFIPALRSMLAPPSDTESKRVQKGRIWDKTTNAIASWVTGTSRHRVYGGVLLFVIITLIGVSRVTVDNSTKSFFSPELIFETDDKALNDRLGGTNTMYLLIEGASDDAIKNPKTLHAIEELQRFLEKQPYVGKTLSLADFIMRMNQAMHGDDPAYYKIPDSQELISQYLLLYSMSGEPGDFDSYVDFGYRSANLTVFLKTDSSAYIEKLVKEINAFTALNFDKNVHIGIGGSVPQGAALNEVMVYGKILNILQITVVVFIISSLIFRSLIAGMLVLLPLLVAVLANFGLMGWSGIPLNISTSLISAMAVGIGADYAIYLIYRLREELIMGTDEITAVRNVIGTAGQAILFVAISVSAGYGVLLLSFGYNIHKWLAILIAEAMIMSSLSALLLIPALILTFRPDFIFRRAAMKQNSMPISIVILVLVFGLSMQSKNSWAAEIDLTQIMQKNFVVSKVYDSMADATFTLINKSGQERVRKTFGTTKLEENSIDNMRMTRFLSPPDVKGTVSLLIEHADKDDDIWIYLPALKKVRRLVSNNKKDSFVGTDFSYADVIGYKVGEWNYKLLKEELVEGQPCYVIEAIPKSETVKTNNGYSKRVGWLRKDNLMAVKMDFWDEAGQLLKTSTYTDIQLVDKTRGKWQAMRLEATNVQTGHRTVIKFDNFKANQQVKDEFFTTRYMEKE